MNSLTIPFGGVAEHALALRKSTLNALCTAHDGWCLNLNGLQKRTGISREILRGIITDLRSEGLVEHCIGLWFEDGEPAGAGYRLTEKGWEHALQDLTDNLDLWDQASPDWTPFEIASWMTIGLFIVGGAALWLNI